MKHALGTALILSIFLPSAAFALEVLPGFNPNILIPDATFSDTQTFGGPEGIQRFLESKGSVLANTSPSFVAMLSEPTDAALKTALGDPQPSLGRLRTAAELIWDASKQSGINPQVTLVTLHKEQGLIGNVNPTRLQRALNHAMGFDCPDSSGCGNLFPGFYYQLFGNVDTQGNRYLGATRSLMKSFTTPGGRGPTRGGAPARIGETLAIYNTMGDFVGISEQQMVTIGNSATAALYRYTPHVFNGNYNFWRYFKAWFKYPNGTLLRSTLDSVVYIISDGRLQRVPAFVAAARNLATGGAIDASPNEIATYEIGTPLTPADNTVISIGGEFFVFLKNVKHPASSFVLTQRKLDPAKIMPISDADASLYERGPQLTPTDGTVLKDPSSPAVYLVSDGKLKAYSEFTYKQHGAAKKLQIAPAGEVGTYPKDGYVPPLDGTLVKSKNTPNVYVMQEGRRLPLTAELFKNRGYSMKKVVTLTTDEELASLPLGPTATPAEGSFFTSSNVLYVFKNGAKHPIFPAVAKQRGITPDYAFEDSITNGWPDGIAIAPRDGTLVKAKSSATVYHTQKGQLLPLTADIFKLRKFSAKSIVTLADLEVEALPKGGHAEPPENTYFSVKGSGEFYVFQKGTKRRIYTFVAKQRKMTPDFTFEASAVNDWTLGDPVLPRDGSLLKSEGNATIYLVSKGVLRPLSTLAFAKRGYKMSAVTTIPAGDLNAFAKGAEIAK